MKQILTVLRFELGNYFKNKAFVTTTLIIAIIIAIGLSIPSFIDMSGITGSSKEPTISEADHNKTQDNKEGNNKQLAVFDEGKVLTDENILKEGMPNVSFKIAESLKELNDLVMNEEVEEGYHVRSLTDFTQVIKNSSFSNASNQQFKTVLETLYRTQQLQKMGLNYNEIESVYQQPITANQEILGKDSVGNYLYTYILLFVIYIMILMYGQLVATSITTEKSNRAIEILVTSTSSNSLIFGKVIGAALASFVQVGVILGAGILSYKINGDAWNGMLDMIFKIPGNVLLTFATFGLFGYLFYAFIYGALGALVSKTEDIGKSSAPIMTIFIVAFFIGIIGLQSSDSLLVKITSFIPFTSCNSMLIRVAMGNVTTVEILISFAILVASTVLVGLIGAKIYRMGTLMYGNPIKLSKALKFIKNN